MISNHSAETEILKLIVKLFNDNESQYESAFKSNRTFTEFISMVVDKIAETRELMHWREYYTLDHVLYGKEDQVPEGELPYRSSHVHGTWLKHIKIAIEHENNLDTGGGYQEFAKLMLFNADIKVLMGYANKGENYDLYAYDYQWIFNKTTNLKSLSNILFIGEYGDIHVDAYLITGDGLLKYQWESETWSRLNTSA